MIYLCNSFSPLMLPRLQVEEGRTFSITRISAKETGTLLRTHPFISAFGHSWAAWHLSRYLQTEIPASRHEIRLTPNDTLILATVVNKHRWSRLTDRLPKWVFYRVEYRGSDAAIVEPSNGR